MNWDGVKYIFQIPLDWYRGVHKWIENSYGTDFLTVTEGAYGGQRIGIDQDAFVAYVNEAISGDISVDLSGYVKSVNDIKPDENGNVDLNLSGNYLEASDITSPGTKVGKSYAGDKTVTSPNHYHDIEDVDGAVKTVDGVGPDENGDVKTGSAKFVNWIPPDEDGNIDLDLSGYVRTVNGEGPDEDGNIELDLSSLVKSVDHVGPDSSGNIQLNAVKTVQNVSPVNGNVDLTNVFSQVGHTHEHTDITDWDSATVEFLVASDITTPGDVVGPKYTGDKTVTSPNHKHNASDIVNSDTDGFVTIDTQQTITGLKQFTSTIHVANNNGTTGVQIQTPGAIGVRGDNPIVSLMSPNSQTNDIGHLGYASSVNVMQLLSNKAVLLVGNATGNNNEVVIKASQNQAQLDVSPSTDGTAPNLAIATVGWVKEKALTVPDGKTPKTQDVTLVSNVTWNGTQIVIQKQKLEFSNGVLTNVTGAGSSTIETVAYSPS